MSETNGHAGHPSPERDGSSPSPEPDGNGPSPEPDGNGPSPEPDGNSPSRELGASAAGPAGRWPAPDKVAELAEACVRFVERALGVRPDYQPETLPLVDHWVADARRSGAEARPELAVMVAHAAGAYFGEVVRRRYVAWWDADDDHPGAWEVQLSNTYLSLRPVEVVELALRPGEGPGDEDLAGELALIDLDEEDRPAVAARLAELPPVSEDEYRSLSTLLEVIDIAVDASRARRLGAGEPEPSFSPEDYRRSNEYS